MGDYLKSDFFLPNGKPLSALPGGNWNPITGKTGTLPGVSDSAISSMFESINPGSGVGVANTGVLPGQGGITSGAGKGTGLAEGVQGFGKGLSAGGLNKPQDVMSLFKPQQQSPPQPQEINPSKGPVAPPPLTQAQQRVGRPYSNVLSGGSELQKLLQLLKGLK